MKITTFLSAIAFATPLAAGDITVTDAFARILPGAKAGAVYMVIGNAGTEEDRLTAVATPVAARAAVHRSMESADGMMQMQPLDEGLAIAPGARQALASGGDHIMLMGLRDAPAGGGTFPLTLTFERAGEITLDVPVDNSR